MEVWIIVTAGKRELGVKMAAQLGERGDFSAAGIVPNSKRRPLAVGQN